MPNDRRDSTTFTGPTTDPQGGAPTVAEMPAVETGGSSGPMTAPDMPAVVDDEATRVDPSPGPVPKKPATAKPAPAHVPARQSKLDDDDDEESTKATGTPKKAREAQKLLEESRRLNAAGGPRAPTKKLHPLVPIAVAFVVLAAILLALNWLVRSGPTEPVPEGTPSQPGQMKKFFDW
ncbi:MAG: hypothetical protein JNK82_35325 [Myxococcaceae bacterium]|nr:hypothetical protein [Myxococcaceae bacterium]